MRTQFLRGGLAAATLALALVQSAAAHDIRARPGNAVADFDVVQAAITTDATHATFRIRVAGQAGATRPEPTGTFAGSDVYAYVWPTSLDTASVGFDPGQGILALAVTFHPDFDDGAPGRVRNRTVWHSHWVVLAPDDACGPGALKVRDIPAGAAVRVPGDWPGVPLLLSSPDLPPVFSADSIEVRVELAAVPGLSGVRFDGVTAGLKVNANLHAPLLCVAKVFDVASGDLSLPGRATDAPARR